VAELQGVPRGAGTRVAIVMSRFNGQVTSRLLSGAIACLAHYGVREEDVDVLSVPGAWELPLAARLAADRGVYAAIVALGCVIRGETSHFDFVAGPAANGLARVAEETRVPVALGLLTTDDLGQALARAGGRLGNKGWDAAEAALEMADLARGLRE
jgi:6,7-dimethyl-8-ribityllumazine synthase